ncbi:hypothetical protein C8R46DRAFT_1341417 [Mycena filopes]|nr:hypothetical protein C8R46DRAFT_1341417 [Mycena filopes]
MAESNSPPAKRQRSEGEPIMRGNVWYTDGSVVLQAVTTQFRVHWGVLTQHSSFFLDLEKLPQPPDQPSIDGCPVIELLDPAEDVENLLKALYNPLFNNDTALPFPVLASVVRLSRKYLFERLLNAAVDRLTFEYPTKFEDYEAQTGEGEKHSFTCILSYPGIHYDVITLARENNLLSVLPCAYYRATPRLAQDDLFDGIPRGDGTTATLLPIDQRRCVLGRQRLTLAQVEPGNTFGWLQAGRSPENCPDAEKCNAKRKSALCRTLLNGKLVALTRRVKTEGWNECVPCKQELEASIVPGRRRMWQELPSFYDLPPWAELRNTP